MKTPNYIMIEEQSFP